MTYSLESIFYNENQYKEQFTIMSAELHSWNTYFLQKARWDKCLPKWIQGIEVTQITQSCQMLIFFPRWPLFSLLFSRLSAGSNGIQWVLVMSSDEIPNPVQLILEHIRFGWYIVITNITRDFFCRKIRSFILYGKGAVQRWIFGLWPDELTNDRPGCPSPSLVDAESLDNEPMHVL